MRSLLSLSLLLLATAVRAISPTGQRLLVLVEDVAADKKAYSKLLGDLQARGYQISYKTPKSESLKLFELGEREYDHVLFLPTRAKGLGPNLTPQILLEFMNKKGNIMVTLTAARSPPVSLVALLSELDIHLPEDRKGVVVDHFNYDQLSAEEKHDVLLLPTPGPLRPDVRDFFSPKTPKRELIAFPSGMGQVLGQGPLLSPVLRGPATAYGYSPEEQAVEIDDVFAAGKQLSLVTAVQALNSARLVVVGSAGMLADQWFDAEVKKVGENAAVPTVNREFAKRITGWAFQETGILRTNSIEHRLLDKDERGGSKQTNPKIYKVKSNATYSISISEYQWDSWKSFTPPKSDAVQLEFSMLSPFVRQDLKPTVSSDGSTTFSTSFQIPDQHGIFNFLVTYKRPFYSNIEEKTTVSVRHEAHDEFKKTYELNGAHPWLAGIAATMLGWLSFVALWLYSKPPGKTESKKTR